VFYLTAASAETRSCVVKRIDINRKSFKLVMRESWFLRQLRHPNIARLLQPPCASCREHLHHRQ
jgi:hypothetical protein